MLIAQNSDSEGIRPTYGYPKKINGFPSRDAPLKLAQLWYKT